MHYAVNAMMCTRTKGQRSNERKENWGSCTPSSQPRGAMFFAPLAQKILPYAEMQQSSGTMWNDSSQVWHSTFSSDASHPFASPDLAPDTQTSTAGAGAGSRKVDLSRRAVPQQSLDSGSLAGDITNGRRAVSS